jgi:hypothetical protein
LWSPVGGLRLGGLTGRTLTPRQTTHVKEAPLKEDITVAHTGYGGKTIRPKATKTRKNTPLEAPNTLTTVQARKRKTIKLDNKYTKGSSKTPREPKLIYVTLGHPAH